MALRRQVKNVVRNFSDIEVKVRESTSNDPWGPSSSLMGEIADATYNVQAFSEIMVMLWKRINDHGKNWRHVYKSLYVLDYIVKTGSERVAQQCRENIFAIKTLKDFQFIDKDGKDQGINVREKSKALVALLKDDERLKAERERALKAKERFTQSQGGIGNTSYPRNKKFASSKYPAAKGSLDDSSISTEWQHSDKAEDSRSTDGRIDSEMEKVRPSNETEEDLQLQIALAMSREEAEREKAAEDSLVGMAVINSQQQQHLGAASINPPPQQSSTLLNLTEPGYAQPQLADPWSTQPAKPVPQLDPWGAAAAAPEPISQPAANPWAPTLSPPAPAANPWASSTAPITTVPISDPWSSASQPTQPAPLVDPFAPLPPTIDIKPTPTYSSTPFIQPTPAYNNDISTSHANNPTGAGATTMKPSFLKDGAHLVDVENILATTKSNTSSVNPFMTTSSSSTSTNPFAQDKPKPKSINELRNNQNQFTNNTVIGGSDILMPTPSSQANNPFL